MKVQKKQAKNKMILSLCICLLILVCLPVSAMADTEKRGELQFKIDRIIDGSDEGSELRETELERTFPGLFSDDVGLIIEETEKKNQQTMEELEKSIFTVDLEANSTVDEVKDALFSEDYTVVASGKGEVQEEDNTNSSFSNTILTIFSGLGILLFGGLYFMMRSMFD
jgi:type VII secretion protein EssA